MARRANLPDRWAQEIGGHTIAPFQLLHPQHALRLPGRDDHGELTDPSLHDELLTVHDVYTAEGERLRTEAGRNFARSYQDKWGNWRQHWQYVEHPAEEAMRTRLQRLLPDYEISTVHIEPGYVFWQATRAIPAPQDVLDAYYEKLRRRIKTTVADKPWPKTKTKRRKVR